MNIDQRHAEMFVEWLMTQAVLSGRGDHLNRSRVRPDGKFWLGRLAPEQKVRQSRLGERGERRPLGRRVTGGAASALALV